MNIFQKLSAATSEIMTVAKNLEVSVGKGQYKAVGEADVLAAVKPIEKKFGIYSYPYSREIVSTDTFVTNHEYNGQVSQKTSIFLRIKTVYRFVDIDKPEEFVDITTYGDGVDPQDKAPGKAMTYSDKYALLKAYKITTGDDPDQKPSQAMEPSPPTELQLSELEKIGVDISKVAVYYKTTVEGLSAKQVQEAIDKKRQKIGKENSNG